MADPFDLSPPEREKYRRNLAKEAKGTIWKKAGAEMRANIAELESLRAVDPGSVQLARTAQEQLNALGSDERFLTIAQDRNHPQHEEAMNAYRFLCETACCDVSSNPAEANWQRLMGGGSLKVSKPEGAPPDPWE